MNVIIRVLALAVFAGAMPAIQTGCKTPPSARVIQAQTLLAVGHSAEAAVALSAHLFRDGKITPKQARHVMDFFDNRFQPSYRFAVVAARGDLSSVASPDLAVLASQLAELITSFQNQTK